MAAFASPNRPSPDSLRWIIQWIAVLVLCIPIIYLLYAPGTLRDPSIGNLSLRWMASPTSPPHNEANTSSCIGNCGSSADLNIAAPELYHCGEATKPGWTPPPAELPMYTPKDVWKFDIQRFWDRSSLKYALSAHDPAQLVPVFQKLYSGQRLVVGALGSSVTSDFGGLYQPSLEAIRKLVPNPPVMNYEIRQGQSDGWAQLFMHYVNRTWPHNDHILVNSGIAAMTPGGVGGGLCLEPTIPSYADILIIETMGRKDPLGIERVIWRIMHHFKTVTETLPAIIIYNSLDVAAAPPKGEERWGFKCREPLDWSACCANFSSGVNVAMRPDQQNNLGEDFHHALANYYGFASISHRDFLWPWVKNEAWTRLNMSHGECEFMLKVHSDTIHPTKTGQVLMADYLWEYMSVSHQSYIEGEAKAASNMLPNSLSAMPRTHALPKHAFQHTGRDSYLMRCYGYLAAQGSHHFRTDREDNQLGAVSELPIIGGGGFNFTLFAKDGNTEKRKPGWIATTAGAYMDIKVDTRFPANVKSSEGGAFADAQKSLGDPPADVNFLYLRSYEHMGKAEFSCVSGCTCETKAVDAHNPERVSVSESVAIPVTESKDCVIRVKVLSETSTGEHKFKVLQVTARKQMRNI